MNSTDKMITILPAPAGYDINFDHPQRLGIPETYWVVGIGNFISMMFFVQRLYTKVAILKKFNWDDMFFVLSWTCCVAVQILCCHLYASGSMGVHAWEIPIAKYSQFSLLVMVSSAVYAPGTCFAKLSLLCFYYRLTAIRWFRWATVSMVLFVIGGYAGIVFSLVFGCYPIQKSWDVTVEGTCINTAALYIATAVFGVVSDLVLLAMPIPIVLGLQLRTFQKAGLILLFAIGSMTLVTSIVRLVLLFPLLVDFDQTWAIVNPFTWICVEANLLVVCASLCTLRKFILTVCPRLLTSTYGQSGAPPQKTDESADSAAQASVGARRQHARFSRFHDSPYGLGTFTGSNDVEVRALSAEERGQSWLNVQDSPTEEHPPATVATKLTTVVVEHGNRDSVEVFRHRR